MAEVSVTIGEDTGMAMLTDCDHQTGYAIVTEINQAGFTVSLESTETSALVAAIHACRRSMAHQLYAEGWSKRQIGLALNVGRRTIQLWLKEEES